MGEKRWESESEIGRGRRGVKVRKGREKKRKKIKMTYKKIRPMTPKVEINPRS